MTKDKRMYWHNFDTGEADYVEAPKTDEEAVKYLPIGAARNLYTLYREHEGLKVIEAMTRILSHCVGEGDKT